MRVYKKPHVLEWPLKKLPFSFKGISSCQLICVNKTRFMKNSSMYRRWLFYEIAIFPVNGWLYSNKELGVGRPGFGQVCSDVLLRAMNSPPPQFEYSWRFDTLHVFGKAGGASNGAIHYTRENPSCVHFNNGDCVLPGATRLHPRGLLNGLFPNYVVLLTYYAVIHSPFPYIARNRKKH
jgi:hypothetical protein